jgi:transposase
VDQRATLNGVRDVLRTGIAWRHLPTELGRRSGVTCWYRRCRDACVERGLNHRIARQVIESKHRLGQHR